MPRMDLASTTWRPARRSILGIFSLDLSKPITMEIYTDSCDDLLSDIKPFMA